MPPGLTNSALPALGCLHVRTLPFQVGITFTRSQPSNALPVGVLIGSICSTFAFFPQSPEVGKALDRTTLCHRSMVSRSRVEFAQKAAALPALRPRESAHCSSRAQQNRHQALASRLPRVEGGGALVALQLLQLGKDWCHQLHLSLKYSLSHLEEILFVVDKFILYYTTYLWSVSSDVIQKCCQGECKSLCRGDPLEISSYPNTIHRNQQFSLPTHLAERSLANSSGNVALERPRCRPSR